MTCSIWAGVIPFTRLIGAPLDDPSAIFPLHPLRSTLRRTAGWGDVKRG